MRQLTESAVNEVALDGQNLSLCRGEVRNFEHGPEPDVLPAMHGSSGAIADRAVRQGGAARWPASGRDETAAKSAGSMKVVMSAIRPRRPAAGGHIAAGRGRACGWRVTDPARRALTRLKVSSRTAVWPGAAARRDRDRDLAVMLHLTCSAVVRPRGER